MPDEIGYLRRRAIKELPIVSLTELEVRNVISYYSMRPHPHGKYNVQVCTTLRACCAVATNFRTLREEFAVKHKDDSRWPVLARRGGMHRACSWHGRASDYDFHENLTAEKLDQVLDEYKRRNAIVNEDSTKVFNRQSSSKSTIPHGRPGSHPDEVEWFPPLWPGCDNLDRYSNWMATRLFRSIGHAARRHRQ